MEESNHDDDLGHATLKGCLNVRIISVLCRKCFQRRHVRNGDSTSFDYDQAVLLESSEGAGDDLTYRANAGGNFLIGLSET